MRLPTFESQSTSKIAVIQEMHEVLDRPNRRVRSAGEAFVSFSLLSSADKTLDLDDFLHILIEKLFLLRKLGSHKRASDHVLEAGDRRLLRIQQ